VEDKRLDTSPIFSDDDIERLVTDDPTWAGDDDTRARVAAESQRLMDRLARLRERDLLD
jgi:hypothetical protein